MKKRNPNDVAGDTWKRVATLQADRLHYHAQGCSQHTESTDSSGLCGYCSDAAVYQFWLDHRKDPKTTWQELAHHLASAMRFYSFCDDGHNLPDGADPDGCPFCDDWRSYQRYLWFCKRQGVQAITTATTTGPSVSIWDLRESEQE